MISNQSITSMKHVLIKELAPAPFEELVIYTDAGEHHLLTYDMFRRLYNDAVDSMISYRTLAEDYLQKYEAETARCNMLEQSLMELSE